MPVARVRQATADYWSWEEREARSPQWPWPVLPRWRTTEDRRRERLGLPPIVSLSVGKDDAPTRPSIPYLDPNHKVISRKIESDC